jgi:hypothetical protein
MFYMDFLTFMGFLGVILLVIINAIIVKRMDVVIHDEGDGGDEKKGLKGDDELCRTTQS